MRKFFVKENQINSELITILDEDVNHIKNVLRLNVGENLQICDIDSSKNYICEILELTAKSVTCKILEEIQSIAEGNVELHIFQGLPKADKMEC